MGEVDGGGDSARSECQHGHAAVCYPGEYAEAKFPMSIQRVQDKFDQRGAELYRAYGWMEKEYFTCTGGSVTITYKHNRTRGTWVLRYKYADRY